MARSVVRSLFAASAAVLAVTPSPAAPQSWFMDIAFDQSFSSSDPFRDPGGFSASTGAVAVWGPVGLHATFRRVTDGGEESFRDCEEAPASCVPGTLAVSYTMRSAGLGISYDFINPTDVMLTLGLTATRNWRTERVDHLATGQRFVNDLPTGLGVSASAHLRLRPLLGALRPEFSVRYDYSGSGECAADAACLAGHEAYGVSIGFSWVLREPRQD